MVRTDLVPTVFGDAAGLVAPEVAANVDGHAMPNAGRSWFLVTNGGGAPINVTIKSVPDPFGRGGTGDEDNDLITAVANDSVPAKFGPFQPTLFNQKAGAVETGGNDQDKIYIDFSAVASVTVRAETNP